MAAQTLDQQLVKVLKALCLDIGTAVSHEVLDKVQRGDIRGLVQMRVNPNDYKTATAFRKDNAAVELLRKCLMDIPGIDKRDAALQNFKLCEISCAETNHRFRKFNDNWDQTLADVKCLEILEVGRLWIKRVLGPLPAELDGRFGPGSTYGDRSQLVTLPDKLSSKPTITKNALCLLDIWRRTTWCDTLLRDHRQPDPELVRGNRFTTVPKDAEKDRGIGIEPSITLFYQLGVGRILRNCLRKWGIDLKIGQGDHRNRARRASRDEMAATIDLSNASDTVSYQLVRYLLPPDWFALLETLRSPFTLVDGKWWNLEKFSSMGNGFTFELETLIFAAICKSVGCGEAGRDFSVYGDDIIVPTDRAEDVLAALRFCGFTPNKRKTFVSGPFRESCGGDFFLGEPVRAHYLKEVPHEPQHWISLANGLSRLGRQDPSRDGPWSFTYTARKRCLDALPSDIRRLHGPEQLGDLVIHDEDRATWVTKTEDCIRYVKTYSPVSKSIPWCHWTPNVMYACAIYGLDSGDVLSEDFQLRMNRGVTPRDSVSGYRKQWVAYS